MINEVWYYPDDPSLQIEQVLTTGATSNGIYALKLFPDLFETISAHAKFTEALPNLRFVQLRRRDLLGQAMSWFRANHTKHYRSTNAAAGECYYNGRAIRRHLGRLCQHNARWDMYFARTGIEPIELVYEDIVEDPQRGADRVADLMGVSPRPRIDIGRLRLQIQRDASSREWRERFLRDHGDPNIVDPVEAISSAR